MKKIKFKLVLILLVVPFISFGQKVDCQGKWDVKPTPPYEESSFTKTASCVTGKKYEFVVPFSSGFEYKLSFYASSSFNRKMNFILEDLNSGSEILNLPGEAIDDYGQPLPEKGKSVLAPYRTADNKLVHPFFVIAPENSTNVKIIIDIPHLPGQEEIIVNPQRKTGCVKIQIWQKKVDY